MSVKRVYVEKQVPYAIKAKELKEEIKSYLGIKTVTGVRVLIRYDIENLSEEAYEKSKGTIFSEPPVDQIYEGEFPHASTDVIFLRRVPAWPVRPARRLRRTVCQIIEGR